MPYNPAATRTTGRPNFRGAARSQAARGTSAPKWKQDEAVRAGWYPANWPEISAAVRQRDGFRCQIKRLSGERTCTAYFPPPFHGNLHVHHIEPLPGGSNHPRNLITLCRDCHSFVHGRSMGKKISERAKAAAAKW